jgi:hypothetical protein
MKPVIGTRRLAWVRVVVRRARGRQQTGSRLRELNPERRGIGAFSEPPRLADAVIDSSITRWRIELKTRNWDRLIQVHGGSGTPHALTEHCNGSELVAVASFHPRHAGPRPIGRVAVGANGGSGLRLASHPAQQGDVLPNGKYQRDRNDYCPEHVGSRCGP